MRPRNMSWEEFEQLPKVRGGVGNHATDQNHVPGPKATTVSNRRGSDRPSKNREPGINPAPSPKSRYAPYRNKLEFNFAQTLVIEKHAKLIQDWAYESMTLKLSTAAPGKRGDYHRSDFLIWHLDNSIEIAQTKGWHLNIAASLKGLRWAAQKNPWFKFTIRRYNNGWHTEEVKP